MSGELVDTLRREAVRGATVPDLVRTVLMTIGPPLIEAALNEGKHG